MTLDLQPHADGSVFAKPSNWSYVFICHDATRTNRIGAGIPVLTLVARDWHDARCTARSEVHANSLPEVGFACDQIDAIDRCNRNVSGNPNVALKPNEAA